MDSWQEWSKHVLLELQRLNTNSDRADTRLEQLAIVSAENTSSLKEHMRRTEAAEEQNELLKQLILTSKLELVSRIDPLEVVADRVKFVLVVVSIVFSAAMGLTELGFFTWVLKL